MIFRYSCVYILVTVLVLAFLYQYTGSVASNLIFQAKESAMLNKAQVVASSFSGMDALTEDSVTQVMLLLDDLDTSRTVVTNPEGRVLYDSSATQAIVGDYALFPEVVNALEGNDVFYCVNRSDAIVSRAAMPLMYRNNLIGAVYLMEIDTEQADILSNLTGNIANISILLAVVVALLSVSFILLFSMRMRRILQSIQIVREGEYSHKLRIRGSDELGQLAREFNLLTDRIQRTETQQRQFVSDASHELKTPLASIKLLSDSILQNDMDMETMREFVQDIGNEADRLTRMSEKLLSLSRLESVPDDPTDREIVTVSAVAERVFRMLRPLAELNQISMHGEYQDNCTILGTQDDLYQILFNLVENAIKYNVPDGSVEVTVSRYEDDVVIQIADTGVGIPEEDLPHIFDRFYRVDKARSRKRGGSGLGLSIVREMVERNYGTVSAARRSESGGTVFTVEFPWLGTEVEDE
jgi:signal transduction histidine kinase